MLYRNVLPVLALVGSSFASNVLELTPKNFDNEVFAGVPSLVEFFAPWCGHCKNLAPTYEELADSLKSNKGVKIAKVDGDDHKSLASRYGVQGFPTIKWFDGKSTEPEDYEGGRDLESLQKWVEEKSGAKSKKAAKAPSNVKILTDSTFNQTIGGDQGVLVAFTAQWCGHCKALAPVWETLANDVIGDSDVLTIAKIDADNEKKTAKAYGITGYPTIKYFPAGSKEPLSYDSGRDISSLISYVNEKAGIHRKAGGGLDFSAGTLAALDKLVENVSGRDIDTVIKEVTAAAADLKDKSSEYYVKVLDKIKANSGYLEKETSRLQGILEKGGLARSKEDNLQRRLNVLKKFAKGEATIQETFDDIKAEL